MPRTTKSAAAETQAPETKATRKPAAERKPPKYDEATKAATKRAQALRGRSNAVAPVTVVRVQALLERERKTAEQVVKSFRSIKEASSYADASDKTIKTPTLVAELGKVHEDAFGRGRGLVAICLALREAK